MYWRGAPNLRGVPRRLGAIPHDEMVAMRRHLHMHPELSMVEHATAAFVARELAPLGLDEIRTGIGETGVVGTLVGGKPGPVTLLRADMDGLPILESNDVPYRSRNDGIMHACGHDGHVAILLAAARGWPRSAPTFPARWCSVFNRAKRARPARSR